MPISLKYTEVEKRPNSGRKGRPRTWYGGAAEMPSDEDEELRRSNSLEDFAKVLDEGSDDESLASGTSNSKDGLLQTLSSLTEKQSRTESFMSSISDVSAGKGSVDSDLESEHGDDYEHEYTQEDTADNVKGIAGYERIVEHDDEYEEDENEGDEEREVRDVGDIEVHVGIQEDGDEVVEEHKDVVYEDIHEHEGIAMDEKLEKVEVFETHEHPHQITAGSNVEGGDVESEFKDRHECDDSEHGIANTQHDFEHVYDEKEHEFRNSEHAEHEYQNTEHEYKDTEPKSDDTEEKSIEIGEEDVAEQECGEAKHESEDRNDPEEIEDTERGTYSDNEENTGEEGTQGDNEGEQGNQVETICNGLEDNAGEPKHDEGDFCSHDKDTRSEENATIDTSEASGHADSVEDLGEGNSNHNEELQLIEENQPGGSGLEGLEDSVEQSSHTHIDDEEVAQDLANYKEIGESELPNVNGSIDSQAYNEDGVVEEVLSNKDADHRSEAAGVPPDETNESEGLNEESGDLSVESEDRPTESESLSRDSEDHSTEHEDLPVVSDKSENLDTNLEDRPTESDDQSEEVKSLPTESDVGTDDLANDREIGPEGGEDNGDDDGTSVKIQYEDLNDIECEVQNFCTPGENISRKTGLFRIQADDVESGEDSDHGKHIRFDEKASSLSPMSDERSPRSPEDPFGVPMRTRSALLLKLPVKRSGSDVSVTSLQDVKLDVTNRGGDISPGLNSSRKAKSFGDLSTFSEGRSEMVKDDDSDEEAERRRIQEDHTVN
jgi:hypothetical protein